MSRVKSFEIRLLLIGYVFILPVRDCSSIIETAIYVCLRRNPASNLCRTMASSIPGKLNKILSFIRVLIILLLVLD